MRHSFEEFPSGILPELENFEVCRLSITAYFLWERMTQL